MRPNAAKGARAKPAVVIGRLRRSEVASCAALITGLPLWQRYRYSPQRCARDLRAGLARADELHVARRGKALLGLAWVLPRGVFGRTPYLKILAVDDAAQGLGVGASLLRAAEHHGELLLLVSHFNRGAQRFYRRQGYRKVGALPDYVLPGVTEQLMFRRVR